MTLSIKLPHIVRYGLRLVSRYADVALKALDAYESYDYGTMTQALTQFATVDLSAFYNDISKDRMYTLAAKSRESHAPYAHAPSTVQSIDAPPSVTSVLTTMMPKGNAPLASAS